MMNFALKSKHKWLLISITFSMFFGISLIFGWLNPLNAQQPPACSKPIECFTLGQQRLQQAQSEVRQQKLDLQEKLKELEQLKSQIANLQGQLSSVSGRLNSVSDTASQAVAKVDLLQSGIQNGSVIAQKALMLKSRDDNHWLRFNRTDASNHDVFQLWRTDGASFPLIRVQAADKLLARNESHWMKHKGVDPENFDSYGLWRKDGIWFNLIKVGKTGGLP